MVGHKSILHNTKANCISIFCGYKLTKYMQYYKFK